MPVTAVLIASLELIILLTSIISIMSLYPAVPNATKKAKAPLLRSNVEMRGPLGLNQKLDEPNKFFKGQLFGPESFASKDGRIYTGVVGGDVVSFVPDDLSSGISFETRISPPCDPDRHPYEESLCGRVLGLEFDGEGNLIFADAYFGLYKWKRGEDPVPLFPSSRLIDGRPNTLTNSLTISKKTGAVFFTASSTWLKLDNSLPEGLGLNPTGRVLKYDPKADSVSVLVDHVPFANGIRLSLDETFLVYVSVGEGVVYKYYLEGPKAGSSEEFFQPPGIPDNVSPSPSGGFFIGVVAVEENVDGKYFSMPSPIRLFREYPFLKTGYGNLMLNLFNILSKIDGVFPSHLLKTIKHGVGNTETGARLSPPHALIVELDIEGNVVQSFHGTDGALSAICEGFFLGDWMYLGSPYASMDFIARVPLR